MLGALKDRRAIIAKGMLFLALGILAAGLILIRHSQLLTMALLLIAIWSFCRFYFFAFYVLEHYVDPNYRFDGLFSTIWYLFGKNPRRAGSKSDEQRD